MLTPQTHPLLPPTFAPPPPPVSPRPSLFDSYLFTENKRKNMLPSTLDPVNQYISNLSARHNPDLIISSCNFLKGNTYFKQQINDEDGGDESELTDIKKGKKIQHETDEEDWLEGEESEYQKLLQ